MQKLELTWIGKDKIEQPLEPRILIENPQYSYGTVDESTLPSGKPWHGNMLIHGDNLLALKSLLSMYSGEVKCIYIDPPYNIDAATPYYDDMQEHSLWLGLMAKRIQFLSELLAPDGLLAVQIDDYEFAHLFLVMAEVFGRKNLKTICVKMSEATGVKMASVNKAGSLPKIKEYIILAKKDGIKNLHIERIPKAGWDSEYKTYCDNITDEELAFIKSVLENEERTADDIDRVDQLASKIIFKKASDVCLEQTGARITDEWCFKNANRIVQFATLTGGARDFAIKKKASFEPDIPSAFAITTSQNKMYLIKGSFNTDTKLSRCKILFADLYLTINPGDLWTDIKTTGLDNEGVVDFKNGKKPERLVWRIIDMCSRPGDLVLDSFLGSGTTAAVAHKMRRKYIGVELGQHAYSHCVKRLQAVVDGTDQGGVTKKENWQGGGGFKFYELAPSLLKHDEFGQYVINPEYNADQLAAAMAMQEGYVYSPSADTYWKQGRGAEHDYIFTTTRFMTAEAVDRIAESMAEGESLLICCTACQKEARNRHSNITVKKIPQMLLARCEFDRDNYDLNIVCPPRIEEPNEDFED